jgi:DNA ligase (NAD+)
VEDLADLERMGKRSAQKIVTNIEKSKFAPLARVITGLTIKGIGDNSGKILAKRYGTLDNFMAAKYEELVELQDMGDISATNIVNWLADANNQTVLIKLIAREIGMVQEEEKTTDGKLTGLTFAFTGSLSIGRKEFIKLIEDNGGIESSIKKGLHYLILGDGGKEAKAEKARKYGAEVINEQQFNEMIK